MKELVLESIPKPVSLHVTDSNIAVQKPLNSAKPQEQNTLPSMELLTEYFGFCPIDFVDDIINAVNDLLYKAMDELERMIRTALEDSEEVERVCSECEALCFSKD